MFAFGTPAPKSVDGVMSAFHKTLEELQEVEAQQTAEAARKTEEAEAAQLAADNARIEADRANSVRTKLRALLVP